MIIGLGILGFIVGVIFANKIGAILGAIIGVAIGWSVKLTTPAPELDQLKQEIDRLNNRLETLKSRLTYITTKQIEPQNKHTLTTTLAPDFSESTTPQTPSPLNNNPQIITKEIAAPQTPSTASPPPPKAPPQPTLVQKGFERVIDYFTHGNTLAKIGVVILMIGLIFLAQLAISQGYFPIELRLILIALGGIALLVIGFKLKDKRRNYALTLQGGGVGILYLTTFAAFRLYQLLPAPLTFILLVLVGVLATLLAVKQNAQHLAALGIIGGFLAPMFSSSSSNHIAQFSYYLLINLAVFMIAWFKSWKPLNLISFFFTIGLGSLWGQLRYRPEYFASTEPFLVIFFLLYLIISILYALKQKLDPKNVVDSTLVFVMPFIIFGLQALLVCKFEYGLAWSSGVLALLYFALSWFFFKRMSKDLHLLAESFAFIGLSFLTMTLPFAFDGAVTTISWMLLGVGLIWIGFRQERTWVRLWGLGLQLLAWGNLLVGFESFSSTVILSSSFMFGSLIAGLAALIAAYLFRHYQSSDWEKLLPFPLTMIGTFWWLSGCWSTSKVILPANVYLTGFLFLVTLTVAMYTLLANRLKWPLLLTITLFFPALLVLIFGLFLQNFAHPGAYYGWIVWIAALVVYRWILSQSKAPFLEAAHSSIIWLFTLLLLAEVIWQTDIFANDLWQWVATGLIPCLILGFISLPQVRQHSWFASFSKSHLTLTLIPIALLVASWMLLSNLFASSRLDSVPYVPFLNLIDLVQAASLASLIYWYIRLRKETQISQQIRRIVNYTLTLLGLFFSSAAFARTIHHYAGIPYSFDALFHSSLLQTLLTIFWTMFALVCMFTANKRKLRFPWFIGAGLLGVVVVKLFLVDLANINTFARIISFVGVGLLLLLIAYISPVPPVGTNTQEESTLS